MERGRNADIVFDGSPNVDPITGLPFEARGVRQRLIEGVVEAVNNGQKVYFLEMDLDGLKGINDKYGHGTGNEAIRRFAEEKVRVLGEDEKVEAFYFYRPQAGGDEFKAVIIGGEKEEIRRKMKEEVEMGETKLSGSVGLAEARRTEKDAINFEEGAEIFEKMEAEAEGLLEKEKRKGVERSIEDLIKEVGTGTSEEILVRLAEVLTENRRLSEEENRMLLQILLATARAEGRREGRRGR